MHSTSPGANIYTRIPTRPSTDMTGEFFGNDQQLKLSPTYAESSLVIPTTSASAYVYTSYSNGGSQRPMESSQGTPGGLQANTAPDNNALASSYVLYGSNRGKRQQGLANGIEVMAVTTPLISTANYDGLEETAYIL